MIVLKISNASELAASRLGKFLETLTPDGFDETIVEDLVVGRLIESLQAEGLRGDVLTVKGLDSEAGDLVIRDTLRVRHHRSF